MFSNAVFDTSAYTIIKRSIALLAASVVIVKLISVMFVKLTGVLVFKYLSINVASKFG